MSAFGMSAKWRKSPRNALDSRVTSVWLRALALGLVLVGGWAGCRCRPAAPAHEAASAPALRLVFVSNAAGALEPCGCVKDMLGGVSHAASYLRKQSATPTLLLAAGPLLFPEPSLQPERRTQAVWKAEAMLASLSDMGLKAWAPGANDFAAGLAELSRLTQAGPPALSANLSAQDHAFPKQLVLELNGVKVGVAAVSEPKSAGKLPDGLSVGDAFAALSAQAAELERQGAALRIALLAMPRGEALRLVERLPSFQVALLGKSAESGEINDPPTPPSRVGSTLVIEAPNHLQGLYALDLFVKDGKFVFADADENAERRLELEQRISELERRIRSAEGSAGVLPADLAARRRDLERLKGELARLGNARRTPAGSYYKATLVEVREKLGKDPQVNARLLAYYKHVNDFTREAFKDVTPPVASATQSSYLGVEKCSLCHPKAYAFWQTTSHASAYATLSREFKEFNLDCVGCHVTGYGEAGGSNVTHVAGLENVQCEVCHGPGSRHVSSPSDKSLIVAKPDPGLCAAKCHHLPHVNEDWSAAAALPRILGPGHGR